MPNTSVMEADEKLERFKVHRITYVTYTSSFQKTCEINKRQQQQ